MVTSSAVGALLQIRHVNNSLASRFPQCLQHERTTMPLPVIQGVIDRRLLINYRVDPAVVTQFLPPPFRPQLVHGYAIAGVCLIRFRSLRPRRWPAALGHSSENAAHRIAVQWDDAGTRRAGVYVLHRQTSSRWNAWAGGRLFPGCHDRVRFTVDESPGRIHVSTRGAAADADFSVTVREAPDWPVTSVFESPQAASEFFQCGSIGYSATRRNGDLEGLQLNCHNWQTEPVTIEQVRSSFFENPQHFPTGSLEPDCALLMRGIEHQWRSVPAMCGPASA
mgnify:FL=1